MGLRRTSEDTLPVDNVAFAPDGRHIYVSTSDKLFKSSIIAVEFDGKSVHVQATAMNVGEPMLPPRSAGRRSNYYFLPDGTTLVSFDGHYVRWFDLQALSLMDELALT